ncbi:unnamed protein product [Vicia faba]|uniref:Transmembrane protein n=1 Tax=Vicia faba TaxID=3906 RepID=A0AAV1AEI4_VICFA|nr:unnamed protein product [Vicia faba]
MKERASTLVFQPHYHYTLNCCGALCTYSLYDKQVNGPSRYLIAALLVVAVAAFPLLEPFPSARRPNEEGREEDKKTRSVLLVSQLVASKGCPLSAGCLSFMGLLSACAKEQENGCAKVDARPKQATASPYQRKPWSSVLARFTWKFAHPLAGRGANATRLVGEG